MSTTNERPPIDQIVISAVLPVFNEEQVLPVLFDQVHQALRQTGAQHEVIFVNDGSHDGSAAVLNFLAQQHSFVRVIHLSRNFGHQAAVHAGLEMAQGDVVLLMDSDLQDDPEAVGRFLEAWRQGSDVVYAVRRDRQESWWKRALFEGFHAFLSRVASTPIPADAGNFSLMDRRVVRQILAMAERDRYLPGLRAWVGFRQTGIEVRRRARYDGQPRVSLRGLCRLAKSAIYSFSSLPLAMFWVSGYLSLALFVAVSGFALYCRLFTTLAVPGWTSNVLVASFFGAINSLGISLLGEYVIRIYDQVRGRPIYLVSHTLNARREHFSGTETVQASDAYQRLLAEAQNLVREVQAAGDQRRRHTDPAPSDTPTA